MLSQLVKMDFQISKLFSEKFKNFKLVTTEMSFF